MAQSSYSWMGTTVHLFLEDDLATAYNQAQDAFEKAQVDYEKIHGEKWNPKDSLAISWTKEEESAWHKIAAVINALVEANGGHLDITEEDMTTSYLVKL